MCFLERMQRITHGVQVKDLHKSLERNSPTASLVHPHLQRSSFGSAMRFKGGEVGKGGEGDKGGSDDKDDKGGKGGLAHIVPYGVFAYPGAGSRGFLGRGMASCCHVCPSRAHPPVGVAESLVRKTTLTVYFL